MIIKHYYSNIIPFCVVQTADVESKYLKILNTKEKVFLRAYTSFYNCISSDVRVPEIKQKQKRR